MGLFKSMFKKEGEDKSAHPKGFYELRVSEIKKLSADCVQVCFEVPENLKDVFHFIPGQYVNLDVKLDGKEERRSYSICSGTDETLAVAIKAVSKGAVSKWANSTLKAGDSILVSKPEGNFKLNENQKTVVAFAAGSGITPIMAIAKELEKTNRNLTLFYANKTLNSILFKTELDRLQSVKANYFLSQEKHDGFESGRLNKDKISELIKADLNLLKADAYFLCGPEEMIIGAKDLLKLFGVPDEKVHFELFTTPVSMPSVQSAEKSSFNGMSNVKVILDDEQIEFKLKASGKSILDSVNDLGFDAPYSCRGAVCCTCRAKVLSGKASMTMNYSLTDQEIADGYILTCQAHPASEEIVVSYDE